MHFMVKEMLNISEFTRNCVDFVNAQSLDFCAMFYKSLFVLFHFAIPLSVSLRFTASDYLFGFFWPLYCQSFFDLHLLITPLVSSSSTFVCQSLIYSCWLPLWYHQALVLSVSLWFTVSDYPFGIIKLLFCLSVF